MVPDSSHVVSVVSETVSPSVRVPECVVRWPLTSTDGSTVSVRSRRVSAYSISPPSGALNDSEVALAVTGNATVDPSDSPVTDVPSSAETEMSVGGVVEIVADERSGG